MKDYDDIKIPEKLNDYIDKGIKKGIEHKSKMKNRSLIKIASTILISTVTLGTASNIPVLAEELVKIPILGQLVKVLDFTQSTQFGGVITDGNKIVIDSLNKDSINIYFTDNGKLTNNAPYYKVEYRQYPYTLVFTFSGVRYLDSTYIEDKVEQLPFVKDVYNIMILDDSSYRIAIELNENVDFKITEYKDPAMIEMKINTNTNTSPSEEAYFIRTEEYEYGEQLILIEEMLSRFNGIGVQKSSSEKYIVQLGPYKNKEEANKELANIINETNLDINLFIEERSLGEGPK